MLREINENYMKELENYIINNKSIYINRIPKKTMNPSLPKLNNPPLVYNSEVYLKLETRDMSLVLGN